MNHDLPTAYRDAYEAHRQAITKLVEETRKAFPIGTRVWSQQRHGVVILGEVAGVCEYNDFGCVMVRNIKTGKVHRAYPFAGNFEVVL